MKKGTMMQVIAALNEVNNQVQVTEDDKITIDKHEYILYIYTRTSVLTGCIFELDAITKVLHSMGRSFYLSCTKYDRPTVVVPFIELKK